MILQGTVGAQNLQDGTPATVRQGHSGEVVVTELHGKYYESAYRQNVFMATAAAAALNAAASTTGAPLILVNPTGSGKNVVLIRTIIAPTALPGTQVAGAFAYYTLVSGTLPATPTSVTPQAAVIGALNTGVARAYSAGTLSAAPTLTLPIAGKPGVGASSSTPLRLIDEPDGALVLGPGTQLVVQETVADTTSNYSAMLAYVWEEVAI